MLDSKQFETKVHNHQTGETFAGTIGAIVTTSIPQHLRDDWEPELANYVSFDFWTKGDDGEPDISTFMLTPEQARDLAVELFQKVNRIKVIR